MNRCIFFLIIVFSSLQATVVLASSTAPFEQANQLSKNADFEGLLLLSTELLKKDDLSDKQQAQLIGWQFEAKTALKDWHDQQRFIKQAADIASNNRDKNISSTIYNSIALFKYAQFKLVEAETYFKLALESDQIKSSEKTAEIYKNLGRCQAQLGELAAATSSMLASLKIYQDLDLIPPAKLLNNLGGLSIYLKDWSNAVKYLKMAIKNSDFDNAKYASFHANLGVAYLGQEKTELASQNFRKSIEISDKKGQPNPGALNNLAYIFKKQGLPEKALTQFNRVLEISLELDKVELIAVAKKNIGETWIDLGDRKKASLFLDESYSLYKNSDFKPKLVELYPVIIENYEMMGNTRKALKLMKEFKALNDEMVNVDSNEKIAKLQTAFELANKEKALIASEKELATLAHEKVLKDKAIIELQISQKDQDNERTILLIIVAALSIFGILLAKANRFRAKTNAELAEKNNQIEKHHQELQILNHELKRQSQEDKLTGLKNRRFLAQFLEKEIPRLCRLYHDGNASKQVVILIDLDLFKNVNDQYGHSIGDQVLQSFASILKKCSRESDVLVRWGGEEFLWYCSNTDITQGKQLCERVRKMFSEVNIEIDGKRLNPTCSLGFAPFPAWGDPSKNWEDTLKLADTALYQAKSKGRNTSVGLFVASENDSSTFKNSSIEQLIQNGQLKWLD